MSMEIKYGEGLEFECDDRQQVDTSLLPLEQDSVQSALALGKEEALQQILRHGFRAPVSLSQQMTLTIGNDSFVVFNLSSRGAGIYLNESGQLESQARLQRVSLSLAGQTFVVDGTVVHLSNDGAHYLCGIELTSMTPECQAAILEYLQQSRSALFAT
jgi:hypothetical protein